MAVQVKAEVNRTFARGKAFKLVTYECSRVVITTADDIKGQSAEPSTTWHVLNAPNMQQGQEQHHLQQESKAGVSVRYVGLLGGGSPWPISLHQFLDDQAQTGKGAVDAASFFHSFPFAFRHLLPFAACNKNCAFQQTAASP